MGFVDDDVAVSVGDAVDIDGGDDDVDDLMMPNFQAEQLHIWAIISFPSNGNQFHSVLYGKN